MKNKQVETKNKRKTSCPLNEPGDYPLLDKMIFFMAGYQHESKNVQDTETRNNSIHKKHEQPNKKPISNKQNKNSLTVFHQNICGLLKKKRIT